MSKFFARMHFCQNFHLVMSRLTIDHRTKNHQLWAITQYVIVLLSYCVCVCVCACVVCVCMCVCVCVCVKEGTKT